MIRKLFLVIYLAVFSVYIQEERMKHCGKEKLSFKGQPLTFLVGLISLCISHGYSKKLFYVCLTSLLITLNGMLLIAMFASSREKENDMCDLTNIHGIRGGYRSIKNLSTSYCGARQMKGHRNIKSIWYYMKISLNGKWNSELDDKSYRKLPSFVTRTKLSDIEICIPGRQSNKPGDIPRPVKDRRRPWYLELNHSVIHQDSILAYPLDGYFDEVLQNNPTCSLMKYEWARYSSFNKFPIDSPVSPLRLSQSGFYYKGPADRVACFVCNVEHSNWKIGDTPIDIHRKLNPNCDFITGHDNTNIPIHAETGPVNGSSSTTPSQNTSNESARSLVADGPGSMASETSGQHEAMKEECVGATAAPISRTKHGDIQVREQCGYESEAKVQLQKRPPRHPDYADYQKRNDTFKDWPIEHIIPAKILLAAGFVYAGTADCVRCYQCGIGLKNWEQGDDPWAEHARWAQTCDYLLEHKGPEFVKQHATQIDGAHEHEANVKPAQITKRKTESISKQKAHSCNATEKQDKERKSQHSRSKPAMDQEPSKKGSIEIKEENHRLRSQLVCKICMDKETNTVCLPCGHLVTCEACTSRMKRCAICRTKIQARIKVFMS